MSRDAPGPTRSRWTQTARLRPLRAHRALLRTKPEALRPIGCSRRCERAEPWALKRCSAAGSHSAPSSASRWVRWRYSCPRPARMHATKLYVPGLGSRRTARRHTRWMRNISRQPAENA